MKDMQKIQELVRHIQRVQDNCILLGQRLIERGDFNLGRILIANGFKHDNSKFFEIEWEHLNRDNTNPATLELAIRQHNHTNKHHPEYWGDIKEMPKVYLAELVCDWAARSSEMGSSLMDWIEGEAMKRFGFTKDSEVYGRIMHFVEILLDKKFVRPQE